MIIQRITLTPKDYQLASAYNPECSRVIVECDSTLGAFTVTMPPFYNNENRIFEFHNPVSTGNSVTISGKISDTVTTHVLNVGTVAIYADSMKGYWLKYGS
jgi:hypothetical protein